MEIDFSDLHYKNPSNLLSVVVFLTLVALGVLGWWLTPAYDAELGFLTWTEWQLFKSTRAYRIELTRLQRETDTLAEQLTQTPDPVRAQLTVTRLSRELATGEPALAYARETLLQAALTVQDWAVGANSWDTAHATVADLGKMLLALTPSTSTSEELTAPIATPVPH